MALVYCPLLRMAQWESMSGSGPLALVAAAAALASGIAELAVAEGGGAAARCHADAPPYADTIDGEVHEGFGILLAPYEQPGISEGAKLVPSLPTRAMSMQRLRYPRKHFFKRKRSPALNFVFTGQKRKQLVQDLCQRRTIAGQNLKGFL